MAIRPFSLALVVVGACVSPAAMGVTVAIVAQADTTLFNITPETSSGIGDGLFVGQTNGGTEQRALLRFNLSSIPTGATITAARLDLDVQRASPFGEATTINIFRVSGTWGEGASVATTGTGAPAAPGDATWLSRVFPSTPWSAAGGDFDATASGVLNSALAIGPQSSSSPGLLTDVQNWHAGTLANNGWILISSSESIGGNARKFGSRESLNGKPTLVITYSIGGPCPADFNAQNGVTVQDIFDFLAAWFAAQPNADFNGQNGVTVQDIFDFLAAWFVGC